MLPRVLNQDSKLDQPVSKVLRGAIWPCIQTVGIILKGLQVTPFSQKVCVGNDFSLLVVGLLLVLLLFLLEHVTVNVFLSVVIVPRPLLGIR